MVDESERSLAGAELYLAEVRWRRGDQIRRLSELNQKLVTTFTLNVALIAVLSATLGLTQGNATLPSVIEYLIFAIGFLFCVNIALSAWAYRVGELEFMPNPRALRTTSESYQSELVAIWTANEMLESLERNESHLRRRAFWTSLALATTTLAVVAVIAVGALAIWL